MRALPTFVVAALMATTAWTSTHAAERVDLLLVLAADVSGSMDDSKFELQRSGYAAAFSNPRVIEALRGGPRGRVAAAFIEWSGALQQKVVIDWTVISNDETARQFGDRIMEAPRAFARNSTSISAGIDFGMTQLDRAPYKGGRSAPELARKHGSKPMASSVKDMLAAANSAVPRIQPWRPGRDRSVADAHGPHPRREDMPISETG